MGTLRLVRAFAKREKLSKHPLPPSLPPFCLPPFPKLIEEG